MLPLCLVTGFLGTGKTTFLRHVVATQRERCLIYLVNEFSPQDIDGALIAADGPEVVSIPGGSIFCKCLVGEFIRHLQNLPARYPNAEGIVVEASGMANPMVIGKMLAETGLDQKFRLATTITVVAPDSFLKLRHTLPNIICQIEAADVVLINKIDCSPPGALAATLEAVEQINPAAKLVPTRHAKAEIDLFGPRGSLANLAGDYAACRDPQYATFTTTRDFNVNALAEWLTQRAESVYRIKGRLSDQTIDFSTNGLSRAPLPEGPAQLAWIVPREAERLVRREIALLPTKNN